MVQLTLIPEVAESADHARLTLASAVDQLRREAELRSLPVSDIRTAVYATRARFEAWRGAQLSAAEYARVRAYFNAVLRRRLFASREPSAALARRKLVAASIEADLLASGWGARHAADEALRLTGQAG